MYLLISKEFEPSRARRRTSGTSGSRNVLERREARHP